MAEAIGAEGTGERSTSGERAVGGGIGSRETRGGPQAEGEQEESSAFGRFLDKITEKVTAPGVQEKAVGAGIGALAGSLLGVGPVLGARIGAGVSGLFGGTGSISASEAIGGGLGALAGRATGIGAGTGASIGKQLGSFFDDREKGSTEPGSALGGSDIAGVDLGERDRAGLDAIGGGAEAIAPRASGLAAPQMQQQIAQRTPTQQPQFGGLNTQGPLPLVNIGQIPFGQQQQFRGLA
jgi:hypothetical protein